MSVSFSGEAGETVHCHSNTAFSGCLQDAEMIDLATFGWLAPIRLRAAERKSLTEAAG
jgi:hypothetical protein